MAQSSIKVSVTGGAGQIAYQLLFQLARGVVFGYQQPVELIILDVEMAKDALTAVAMEILDCAFPCLKSLKVTTKAHEAFVDADYCLLIGAKPRGPGMQRQDLLAENGAIFAEQGKSIDKYAKKSAKIIVVGNPCNTNCLIALKNAPSIDPKNFFAMTRLDQNRAQSMLANRLGCTLSDISDLIIWGNHSSTQVVDLVNVKVKGGPLTHLEKVGNLAGSVKERGAEIIKMRGKSSAASAAMALIDTIQDLAGLQPKKLTFSVASHSNKNPYNVAEDIIFSFPTIISQPHQIEIDGRFKVTAELEKELKETEAELLKERDMVKHLI